VGTNKKGLNMKSKHIDEAKTQYSQLWR